jgi:carbon-monoxide dehydrogenase small subunit
MIMAALDLVESGERLDEAKVREGLAGNLCRCTGYHNIVRAVLLAAGANA